MSTPFSIACCQCGHLTPVTPDLDIRVGVVWGRTEIVWPGCVVDGQHVALSLDVGGLHPPPDRPHPGGCPVPVMTLDHAAAHLDLPLATLHCWRTSGHLVAVEHPCQRDVWLVDVQHLLEVDLAMSRGTATPTALPPMTAPELAAWLTERTGQTVTRRAVEDWVEDGDLKRVNPGGRGVRATYDPMRGAAVHAARTRRLPVAPATDTTGDLRLPTATDPLRFPTRGRVSAPIGRRS